MYMWIGYENHPHPLYWGGILQDNKPFVTSPWDLRD